MAAGSSSAVRGLLQELRSWGRYLLPSKYVAVYYPTQLPVARAMLRLAGVSSRDTVFDLGCGDGRICILAAEEFGARSVGVELDKTLADAAAAAVAGKGLQERVQIIHGDCRRLDVSRASVITLYLSDAGNRELLQSVVGLRGGTRVVSLYFPVKGWEGQLLRVDRSKNIDIHLYTAPEQ
uniref:Methyltransferase domain-containing protein n=1 Tax=Tetradesmus obliquus TaxID=3088 RepID=A0A383VK26_TETOB|eukprot:jgi/Sobl393_1/11209/SZX65024.1